VGPAQEGKGTGGRDGHRRQDRHGWHHRHGGKTGTGGTTGTGGSTSTGGQSAGCGVTGSKTGDYTSTIVNRLATRSFEVIVGSGYNPNTPVPSPSSSTGSAATPAWSKAFGLQDAASRAGSVGIFRVSRGSFAGWRHRLERVVAAAPTSRSTMR